eukprot:COSAG01_NODE_2957_length_6795_cov_8.325119_1_plen_188_part_00
MCMDVAGLGGAVSRRPMRICSAHQTPAPTAPPSPSPRRHCGTARLGAQPRLPTSAGTGLRGAGWRQLLRCGGYIRALLAPLTRTPPTIRLTPKPHTCVGNPPLTCVCIAVRCGQGLAGAGARGGVRAKREEGYAKIGCRGWRGNIEAQAPRTDQVRPRGRIDRDADEPRALLGQQETRHAEHASRHL